MDTYSDPAFDHDVSRLVDRLIDLSDEARNEGRPAVADALLDIAAAVIAEAER